MPSEIRQVTIVMLAPMKGSISAPLLMSWWFYALISGPTLLGMKPEATSNHLTTGLSGSELVIQVDEWFQVLPVSDG